MVVGRKLESRLNTLPEGIYKCLPCFPCRGRCPAVRTAWFCSPCRPTAGTKSPSLPSTQKGTDRRHRRSDEHVSRAVRLELWSPVVSDRDKHFPLWFVSMLLSFAANVQAASDDFLRCRTSWRHKHSTSTGRKRRNGSRSSFSRLPSSLPRTAHYTH